MNKVNKIVYEALKRIESELNEVGYAVVNYSEQRKKEHELKLHLEIRKSEEVKQ